MAEILAEVTPVKRSDDGLTLHEFETVKELREHLEEARKVLDTACTRANGLPLPEVLTCVEAAKDRVGDALHDLPDLRDREPRWTEAEIAALTGLRRILAETQDVLARAADLAEKSEHYGTSDTTDFVGEAVSLVRRASSRLPHHGN